MFSATGDRNESQPSTSSIESSQQPCRHFKFSEILLATNNFDESLVIGHGGFGKIYKGNVLHGSSVVVAAIKRLDPISSQGAFEFWVEVEMLSNLRHCHLVSLFGYCNHGEEMILVYQYMPNGTLQDHLHKLDTPLPWLPRLKISIGAARGLDYLHTGTGINVGVIHRDVKSSNILLDESWAAKISDFGLSKTCPTNQPLTYVNTRVKGTFGYLDPDYSFTEMLTRKSDVYAFGVVLLELLCRKPAVDWSLGGEPRNLARWVQETIKEGKLKVIIDSDIRGEISPQCFKEFVRIAERCLQLNPKQRPTMAEVVVSLNSVLILQEKTNTSLQATSKTVFVKMLGMFPSPSKGENSAHASRLSSKRKGRNTSLKVFKFSDLKRATRHFSQDFLLRKDSFETVFLGWVDKNTFAPSTEGIGFPVAIKLYSEHHRHVRYWESEVTILGWLAHPNIIRILGYCDDEVNRRIIVQEYMQNQNLDHFLFGIGDSPDVAKPLPWGTRLMIMKGVARGLAYMHSSEVSVIHGAVTSANILLDLDFNAKLGEFRMTNSAYVANPNKVNLHTIQYLGPEFLQIGRATKKSDIYSFGVVLQEILTGRRVLDSKRPTDEHNLIPWAKPFLKERSKLEKIMDPRLEQYYSIEGAFECAALALRCLAWDREDRPSSEEVLQSLEQIIAAYT